MNIEIKDHVLFIDGEKIEDLPHLPYHTTVIVWRVPLTYRRSGYFISTRKAGMPEEIPACFLSECTKIAELDLEPHAEAVEQAAKEAEKRQINEERDKKINEPVEALGYVWNADEKSKLLLMGAIINAQYSDMLPKTWRTFDNVDVPISSISQLAAIFNAMARKVEEEYTKAWAAKDEIDKK